MRGRICLSPPPTGLDAYSQNALELPFRVTPLLSPGIGSRTRPAVPAILRAPTPGRHLAVQTTLWWFWNINQMSIAYDFRPRLRPRSEEHTSELQSPDHLV